GLDLLERREAPALIAAVAEHRGGVEIGGLEVLHEHGHVLRRDGAKMRLGRLRGRGHGKSPEVTKVNGLARFSGLDWVVPRGEGRPCQSGQRAGRGWAP